VNVYAPTLWVYYFIGEVAMKMIAEPQVHLWTQAEYYKMGEAGLFDSTHTELIEGQVIEMSPIGSRHRTAVVLVAEALRQIFMAGYFIQVQGPLDLGQTSEPEPDVAVISGKPRDYKDAHPTTAVLVVEVADTSLTYDRTIKASLYAKAGIPDYWLLNLNDRRLEIRRNPVPDQSQALGFGYADIMILAETDSVEPLRAPGAAIAVADLLP
jgi:Uma2 family endonuclease